jgi:Zn-dependent protease
MLEINLIQKIALFALPIIFAVTMHEAAHGWVANKFGDDTARRLGRITLNPLPHIDLIGTVLVPLGMLLLTGFVFGWAKPVPVNVLKLHNQRRDMALVALAGPGANIVMMLLWGGVAKFAAVASLGAMTTPLVLMASAGIVINAVLALLNLLPILPLDGGRVLNAVMPRSLAEPFARLEPFGLLILVALLVTGLLSNLLMPAIAALQAFTFSFYGLH